MINRITIVFVLILLKLPLHAQQTYGIDVKKSKILWNNRKIMGGHFGYMFLKSGSINYSPNGEPLNGLFVIDLNTMQAVDSKDEEDNKVVNAKLKSENMFDMAHYPTASMAVKQITRIGNTNFYKVLGDLTIKGLTNPIQFNATIKQQGNTITATAELEVDRLKWHIDMQPSPKAWELIPAMQNKLIASNIAVSLNLTFNKL